MMVINNKFEFGQILYLTTDRDQLPRMVTGIKVCKHGELLYEVMSGTLQSTHYEYELCEEKNVQITVS